MMKKNENSKNIQNIGIKAINFKKRKETEKNTDHSTFAFANSFKKKRDYFNGCDIKI